MKKKIKKYGTVLFCLLISLGSAGCGKSTVEEKLPAADETQPAGEAGIYDAVLAEYADMVQNNFYLQILESGDMDAYEASFGPDIGTEIRTRECNVYYAQFDIDQNGVDELIIAAGEKNTAEIASMPWYYDLYTYDGTKVIRVFPDMEFGYRTNFSLLENGIIEVEGSYSAAESGVEFYQLGSDGITPVRMDSFFMVGTMEDEIVSFQYYQNKDEITEQEYLAKIEAYGEEIKPSLEWIQIL